MSLALVVGFVWLLCASMPGNAFPLGKLTGLLTWCFVSLLTPDGRHLSLECRSLGAEGYGSCSKGVGLPWTAPRAFPLVCCGLCLTAPCPIASTSLTAALFNLPTERPHSCPRITLAPPTWPVSVVSCWLDQVSWWCCLHPGTLSQFHGALANPKARVSSRRRWPKRRGLAPGLWRFTSRPERQCRVRPVPAVQEQVLVLCSGPR